LRVRNKELAQEARFIRHEEKRIKSRQKIMFSRYYTAGGEYSHDADLDFDSKSAEFWELRKHRTWDVRNHARAGLLAYAFLRGKPYRSVERKTYDSEWKLERIKKEVKRLVAKFGKENFDQEVDKWFEVV
jgi:hypothetical protein